MTETQDQGRVLTTERLRMVPCADAHLDGLYAMNSDPEVMRFLRGPQGREETQAMIDRVKARWADWGYSWWSIFETATGTLVGAGCIQHIDRDAGNPIEIGWRLRREHWSRGFASEAARAMAGFAFDRVRVPVLLALADPDNSASRRVMERLGMRFRGVETWYAQPCATYEMTPAAWRDRQGRT